MCQIKMSREWASENKDRHREKKRDWSRRNKEYYYDYRTKNANNPSYKEKRLARQRRNDAKRSTSPKHILSKRMRHAIRRHLFCNKNGTSWVSFVDYNKDDLVAHIEKQFLPGMGWHNTKEWHIDHIIPISSFDYSSPDDPEFKACWALTNLRPMWAVDNMKKGKSRTLLL